jgi:hypothetical protein
MKSARKAIPTEGTLIQRVFRTVTAFPLRDCPVAAIAMINAFERDVHEAGEVSLTLGFVPGATAPRGLA